MKQIKLGYKVPTGEEVFIKPSHLIVTGITQQSGKTTTLEALIQRSKSKAIVFKTKIGEKSFNAGTTVPPFFRDRSDYDFVRSLIEAYSKEKLFIERGTLMTLCKGSSTLTEIEKRINDKLFPANPKAKAPAGIALEIYTRLQHYLEQLIPQIKYAKFSSTLNLVDGINIMDLEQFTFEAQSLIIRSVADEVLKNGRDIIIVIPEAWKFLPQKGNNPCKGAVESFIRQGATNNNFIWIDSQEMASVDKTPLKQISTWILGYQSERNEVSHTLDQISLPKRMKPKEEEVMNLKIGHFFLSSRDEVVQVYVQPTWLSDEDAILISMGKKAIEDAIIKQPLPSFNFPAITKQPDKYPNPGPASELASFATKRELIDLRMDFFKSLQQVTNDIKNYVENNHQNTPAGQEIDYDNIVSLVLQKLPPPSMASGQSINKDEIIAEVLKRVPATQGAVVYEVAPLEKIKKDFLNEAKNKITEIVSGFDNQQKKMLKWIEQNGKNTNKQQVFENCFGKSSTSGGAYQTLVKKITEMKASEIIRVDTAQRIFPFLRERLDEMLKQYSATDSEIQNVYNHILMEIIK